MLRQKIFKVILLPIIIFSISFLSPFASVVLATDEPSADSTMADFFDDYAEMESNSSPENILIIKNETIPEDYGAERIVKASDQTYFFQYESADALDEALIKLKQDNLAAIIPNIMLEIDDGEQNEYPEATQKSYMSWGIEAMGLDHIIDAIENNPNAESVLVAVIDTGVKTSVFNVYFPDRNLRGYCIITCEDGMDDTQGHGTHVIGTIAEGTTNNVELLMIRAGASASFSITNLLTSIEYAVAQGADVLNISASTSFNFDDETYNAQFDMTMGEIYRQVWEIEKEAIDTAESAGVTIVASAGNSGNNSVVYPASYDTAISVGAVDENLDWMGYSPYNEYLDFVAPGSMIYSLNYLYTGAEGQSITRWNQGTSMATPHITAAVADLKSFNKNLTTDNVIELLSSKVIDLGDTGRDDYYGHGFVDFSEAEFCLPTSGCDGYRVFTGDEPYAPLEEDDEEDPFTPSTPETDSKTFDSELDLFVPNTGIFSNFLNSCYNGNMWDLVTNIILILSIVILAGFAGLASYQWFTRKSLKKIDKRLLWIPLPLVLLVITYFLFDKVWILNTRPDGSGEPSFPSTHVMVVSTVLFLVTMNLPKYVKDATTRIVIEVIIMALISLTCIGRVLAEKHWPIDVLGGLGFAFIFTEIYYYCIHHGKKKKAKKEKKAEKDE
ncbi:S8 family serine peptidase [Candidatus Saccharibacteria bacterium]|nr:S8 family serine peptidase [Candidatus Saccharibacteria bacterium]